MEVTGRGEGLEGPKERVGTGSRQGKNLGANQGFWKLRGGLEGKMVWGLMGVMRKVRGNKRHFGVPLEFRHGLESLLGVREWFVVLEGGRTWLGVPKKQ